MRKVITIIFGSLVVIGLAGLGLLINYNEEIMRQYWKIKHPDVKPIFYLRTGKEPNCKIVNEDMVNWLKNKSAEKLLGIFSERSLWQDGSLIQLTILTDHTTTESNKNQEIYLLINDLEICEKVRTNFNKYIEDSEKEKLQTISRFFMNKAIMDVRQKQHDEDLRRSKEAEAKKAEEEKSILNQLKKDKEINDAEEIKENPVINEDSSLKGEIENR